MRIDPTLMIVTLRKLLTMWGESWLPGQLLDLFIMEVFQLGLIQQLDNIDIDILLLPFELFGVHDDLHLLLLLELDELPSLGPPEPFLDHDGRFVYHLLLSEHMAVSQIFILSDSGFWVQFLLDTFGKLVPLWALMHETPLDLIGVYW